MESAVLIIFFNRPDTLEKVFSEVRKAKPPILFLAQDGPRDKNENDYENIIKCRKIVDNIDWECKVYKDYSDENLGCGKRPASAITWAFKNCERLIILEDDCVPSNCFFNYCDKLLDKYENDERICSISGLNIFEKIDIPYDYFFTKYGGNNGWATWKRVWDLFDYNLTALKDDLLLPSLRQYFITKGAYFSRSDVWKKTYKLCKNNKKLSYWDYQWSFVRFVQNSLVIAPKINLITNIGIGANATHSVQEDDKYIRGKTFVNIPRYDFQEPLKHPPFIIRNYEFDKSVEKCMMGGDVISCLKRKIKDVIKKLVKRK